ncbi:hypothetical protein V8J36_16205 [Frigidibacter sp. MR17.14]|uniref:hypothetical protein n=1 Tax=Frigidibacter sp. MR17.14 TaxID=3126509 RepID=UPI003012D46A
MKTPTLLLALALATAATGASAATTGNWRFDQRMEINIWIGDEEFGEREVYNTYRATGGTADVPARFLLKARPDSYGIDLRFPAPLDKLLFRGLLQRESDSESAKRRQNMLSGRLSGMNERGAMFMDFSYDGTWTCSGDCFTYLFLEDGMHQSRTPITHGTYDTKPIPLPAAAPLLTAALGALGVAARARRRRAAAQSRD